MGEFLETFPTSGSMSWGVSQGAMKICGLWVLVVSEAVGAAY